jgi:hypothetical protein
MTLPSFAERLRRRFTGNTCPARGADVEFCVLAEAGVLEAQAPLLCSSIRRFAGAYSSAAIVVVSPRPDRRPCRTTLRDLDGSMSKQGLLAAAWAERGRTIARRFSISRSTGRSHYASIEKLIAMRTHSGEPSKLS